MHARLASSGLVPRRSLAEFRGFIRLTRDRQSLAVRVLGAFPARATTTAVSMLDKLLHHCHTVVPDGDSYRMKQARAKGGTRLNTS